jgi:hypothetical protein
MSVLTCKRRDRKRATEDSNVRSLVDEYIITTSSASDDQSTILDSNLKTIPRPGDAHPNDPLVTVKTRSLRETGNRTKWIMTVNYSNQSDSSDQGGGGGGSGQILKVSVTAWRENFILEKDFKDKPVRNSANDKIKLEMTRPHPEITINTITKNPNFSLVNNVGMVCDGPVNWLGFNFKAAQLLFDDFRVTSIGNGQWSADYVYKAKQVPDLDYGAPERNVGWQPQLLDAGFWELNDDGDPILIYEKKRDGIRTGRPVTQEWPLDGGGKALERDNIEKQRRFLTFKGYQTMGFGVFVFDFNSLFARQPGRA